MSAVILKDFDPERDEKRIDNALFKWFKRYEHTLSLKHLKGLNTSYLKCTVMFPMEPDDFIKYIIEFHAKQLKISVEDLKDELHSYFSSGGSITCSCPEMNQLIYLITYTDRFSEIRYGGFATLKYFDGDEEYYTFFEKIEFRFRTLLAHFLHRINFNNIFYKIETI